MREYPGFVPGDSQLIEKLNTISGHRREDISQFNLMNEKITGMRKVNRIPATSGDVLATDRLGDFSFAPAGIYYLADNAGTPTWYLAAGATF